MQSPPLFRLPPFRVEAIMSAQSLTEVIDWGLSLLHVPDHWKRTRGAGVRVAVIDTGIDESHPDLADAIDDARDFTASRAGPADRNGHGTHVAGIIAARKNNRGVVGVAPESRLLVAKVLGNDGAGTSTAVARGIDWAADCGARVISMSLGSPRPDPHLLAAIQRAARKGIFIIAAAGNSGRLRAVDYPARWRETIAVAAVDRNGRLARFSSHGREVDVAAPGQDILSAFTGSSYAKLSGTSMAAPFVAGIVALLAALDRDTSDPRTPLRNTADLRDHLSRTARDAGPPGHDPGYGWGLIDPNRLLANYRQRRTVSRQPPAEAGG
jgi:subtilisin family serine protease